MIYIIGPRDKAPEGTFVVNTTSRSEADWSRRLSPFFLGPVDLYNGYTAKNVENGWQFTKCYPGMVDENNEPNDTYFLWAKSGWEDTKAHRYPMGKGKSQPLFSYWNGKKMSYLEARKNIYIPLYSKAVRNTGAYSELEFYASLGDIYLWDFDGYDHRKLNMSYDDVINCPSRKMGHAFVLAMLLDKYI